MYGVLYMKRKSSISSTASRNTAEHRPWLEKVVEITSAPPDVLLGLPILTLTGKQLVSIENYRGLIEYTDSLIRVQTKQGEIKIIGSSLFVQSYTADEMHITGQIQEIHLEKEAPSLC